jgi:hypothetical protein
VSDNEEDANRISDALVEMANAELATGTSGVALIVGVSLGMLGVLNGHREFHKLSAALEEAIGELTGLRDKIRFYEARPSEISAGERSTFGGR